MPQFTVYRNKNPRTRAEMPFLVDVQSDMLSELKTRVVIPLHIKKSIKPMTTLTPEFEVDGRAVVLMTPQLAGVSMRHLGEPAGNLKQYRTEILGALDLLITGF